MVTKCPKCGEGDVEEFFCDDEMSKKVGLGVGEYGACHVCHHVFRKCEVWSRVVGYLRPTSDWNKGKQAEFPMRKTYEIPK